jgi:hypothetical protein
MLREDPEKRFNLEQVLSHPWTCKSNILSDQTFQCSNSDLLFSLMGQNNISIMSKSESEGGSTMERGESSSLPESTNNDIISSGSHVSNNNHHSRSTTINNGVNVFSQPDLYKVSWNSSNKFPSFSQPSEMTCSPSPSPSSPMTIRHLILDGNNVTSSSVRHLFPSKSSTRLYSKKSKKSLICEIETLLEDLLIPFKPFNAISFKLLFFTIDKSKIPLNGEISLITLNNEECIIFQKKRVRNLFLISSHLVISYSHFFHYQLSLCIRIFF